MKTRKINLLLISLALTGLMMMSGITQAQSKKAATQTGKPNIVIIWGDDIGQSNLSCYTHGLMGYQTPNIDRVAKAGVMFTDYYAEQSCTAGRASFITGQCGLRTGLTKVGLPGAFVGLQKEDPTIAELLKGQGYATGQFGKNHLGDRDEYLPTAHGFDEFFGNLYHLNAEEEPELRDYPPAKDFPDFREKYGPRGVLHSWANPDGTQKIVNTGPLTKKRMETIDDTIAAYGAKFLEQQVKTGKPVFLWVNFTHMHFRTHAKPESQGQSGRWQSEYHDAMIDHDKDVGIILDMIEKLGIGDNTIVMYSTDNGPHENSWPDAGTTPFRSEKNTNWEGAYRVPAIISWPGHIKAGSYSNDIISHLDMLPTLLAAAGVPDITEKLLNGYTVGNKTFKVHLDGYNMLPLLTGQTTKDPRESFFYFNDDAQFVALRYDNWKIVFLEQRVKGTMQIWAEPFTTLRIPKIYNLRTDPYEMADVTSNTYYDWLLEHAFIFVPAQAYVGDFIKTFKDFPPRQSAASFNLDEVLKKLQEGGGSN
jgi:arylsulfatase A-like enzyme